MITNGSPVAVRGYWIDDDGFGVDRDITFTPVSSTGEDLPNVRDVGAYARIRTTRRTVRPTDQGYYAVLLLASNDPDIAGLGGWRVEFDDDEVLIEVPYNAPQTTADAPMAAMIPEVTVGSQVRALWLEEAAVLSVPAPTPAPAFATQVQMYSAIATAVADHLMARHHT